MSILNYLKVISKSSSDQKHSDFTAKTLDHENSQPRAFTVAVLQPLDWAINFTPTKLSCYMVHSPHKTLLYYMAGFARGNFHEFELAIQVIQGEKLYGSLQIDKRF